MRYLSEINAFYRRQAAWPLSAQAQALWQYLMYRAGAASWHMPLKLGEAEICGAVGLSHGAFIAARRQLVEGGYIVHHQQPGRKRPHYIIESHAYFKGEGST